MSKIGKGNDDRGMAKDAALIKQPQIKPQAVKGTFGSVPKNPIITRSDKPGKL